MRFLRHKTVQPLVFRQPPDDSAGRSWRFISLRWRAIGPLALVVMVLAMAGAYLISDAAARGTRDREIERLLITCRAVADRMEIVGTAQRREVMRIVYTEGVAEAVQDRDGKALHPILEPLAAAADLDYVLVSTASGQEVIGLQRVNDAAGEADYAVAAGTDLSTLLAKQPALFGTDLQAAIMRTTQGHALMTAGPVLIDDEHVGTVLVGTRVEHVLETRHGPLRALDAALEHAPERVPEVSVRHEVVGHRRQQVVRVEVGKPLRSIPARVSVEHGGVIIGSMVIVC